MPSSENYLELSDFTGLLIDNSLSALIKSLENQIQWREQITALDRLSDEEVFANLTLEDIDDWLVEIDPELPKLFDRWYNMKENSDVAMKRDDPLAQALINALSEVNFTGDERWTDTHISVSRDRYEEAIDTIKLHLTKAARHRLSVMKDMGLPALVAEKVEIKSKMSLVSSTRESLPAAPPIADPVIVAPADREKEAERRTDEPEDDSTTAENWRVSRGTALPRFDKTVAAKPARRAIAAPVKAQIVGKLTDLEQIREKLPASRSHAINIAASPTAENSDQQTVNAEITITLRSHFF